MFKMALFDCACDYPCNPWKMLQCWRRTAGVFALFFLSHPGGFDSSRVPTPVNLPSKAKKNANARVSAQGGGGLGAVWIDSYINFSVDTVQQNSNLPAIHTFVYITFIFYLYSFFIGPVEGLCCKPKYRANVIHHSIFFFLPIFFLSLFLP